MARYEKNSTEQGLFLSINLESQFERNSREYLLKHYIKEHLDEELFDYAYKNDDVGRKVKNPKDVTAAILYGYITGNRSSRKIESMLRNHIGFMYVSNCLEIDHSVICEFKLKFQEQIKFVFGQLLYVLNEMGAIDWDVIVGDGTKLKAYASRNMNIGDYKTELMLKTYRKMSEKIVERDLELEKAFTSGDVEEKKYIEEKSRVERQKRKYTNTILKIQKYIESEEAELKKKLETQYVNITDPESKIMVGSSRRDFIQGYNTLMMISNNDVVLDVEPVTDSEKEFADELVYRVEDLKKELNVTQKSRYLFDSGFQDMEKILKLENSGYDMYVATKERDFTIKSQKRKNFALEQTESGFAVKCKGSRYVDGVYYESIKGYLFQFKKSDCLGCKHYRECYKKIKAESPYKTISFSKFEMTQRSNLDSYFKKMKSDEGKNIYNRRLGKEHVFANIKTQKNYIQTYYRGKSKVQMDTCWAALAQNMEKYIVYMR